MIVRKKRRRHSNRYSSDQVQFLKEIEIFGAPITSKVAREVRKRREFKKPNPIHSVGSIQLKLIRIRKEQKLLDKVETEINKNSKKEEKGMLLNVGVRKHLVTSIVEGDNLVLTYHVIIPLREL